MAGDQQRAAKQAGINAAKAAGKAAAANTAPDEPINSGQLGDTKNVGQTAPAPKAK